MKKVFIDSDILLDVILIRPPFVDNSGAVMELTNEGRITGFTSVHCLLNVHYLAKKHIGEPMARKAIQVLINKLTVIPEDRAVIQQAISSQFSDLEDAVQYFTAISAKADLIITRNIKDYKHARIPVLSAEQFLRTIL